MEQSACKPEEQEENHEQGPRASRTGHYMGNVSLEIAKAPPKFLGALACFLLAGQLLADPIQNWSWKSPIPQGRTLAAVAQGAGCFVAVGDAGTIITSPDGYHWTNETSGFSGYLRGVAYADGEFAAVGDGGVILVSSNTVGWT